MFLEVQSYETNDSMTHIVVTRMIVLPSWQPQLENHKTTGGYGPFELQNPRSVFVVLIVWGKNAEVFSEFCFVRIFEKWLVDMG